MENIPELCDASEHGSDADLIVSRLEDLGYWTWYHMFHAEDHGSFAIRHRVYFVAVRGMEDTCMKVGHALV
jgi:site-specific DNA-cytosine methylase